MSAKSARKPPKAPSVPREMPAIQADYQSLCLQAGQLEYQIYVSKQELQRLNESLLNINNEGAARKQLDAMKAEVENAETAPTQETQDV